MVYNDDDTIHAITCTFLNEQWNTVIRAAGAASVRIVGTRHPKDVPVGADFQYIETGYKFPYPELHTEVHETSLLQGCQCETYCRNENGCHFQGDEEIMSSLQAYDKKGRYLFKERYREPVLECNQNCRCSKWCGNRVAQYPRNVPLEIFKTKRCGWGVRATVPLSEGKVIGTFSGKLISRDEASVFSQGRQSYIFDIDHGETETEGRPVWSVDCYDCGNWARFLNHSCEPNVMAYDVCWDTSPTSGISHIAFVTRERIPALTELCIDYNPHAGNNSGSPVSKKKRCFCGAEACRGYIY